VQRTLAINLTGPAHLSYCAARRMAEQGGGRIVNVSSVVLSGNPRRPAMPQQGRFECAQPIAGQSAGIEGVYVFVVAPGWVSTQRVADLVKDKAVLATNHWSGRNPDEVAQVVTYCTLDAPASMTGAVWT